MGKAVRFTLSGKTAFFKKPDSNNPVYFTYSHIHGVVLRGMIGAMVGYEGHIQKKEREENEGYIKYPEFFDKLKDVEIAVIPNVKHGYFRKKIQKFLNTVGYASKEEGGILMVSEQWLEDVSWDIVIKDDGSDEYKEVKNKLVRMESEFIPYLGKNDHPASITNVKEESIEKVENEKGIDSLFRYYDGMEMGRKRKDTRYKEKDFYLEEFLPVGMTEGSNEYVFDKLVSTNRKIENIEEDVFKLEDGCNVVFCV